MPDLALVQALAQSVLPRGIAVAVTDPAVRPEVPFEIEARAVSEELPGRQIAFLAGRAAVREAMRSLALAPQPVPMGDNRAPIWPDGVTGSIAHTDRASVAAVAHTHDWAAVGIDLGMVEASPTGLIAQTCTASERAWLATQPADERGLMARVIFSAKTAACKAQYQMSRALVESETLELRIDRKTSRFRAIFRSDQPPFAAGHVLSGGYVHAAGVLVTAVAIGQSDAAVQKNDGT